MIETSRDKLHKQKAELTVAGYSCRTILGILGQVSTVIGSIGRGNESALFDNLSASPFGKFQLEPQNKHSSSEELNIHERVLFLGFEDALNTLVELGSNFKQHRNHAAINDSFRSLVSAADQITRLRFVDELTSGASQRNPG